MGFNTKRIIKPIKLRWIRYSIYFTLLFICPIRTFSQNERILVIQDEREEKKMRPAYLDISFGVNSSTFRDFATSPLIYSGKPVYASLSHIDMDEKRASHITFSYSFGKYRTDFNEHTSESKVNTISLNYLEIFQLERYSSPNFNLKIGGQFNSTVNLRENEELFNNNKGVDIISTLFGSVKATMDLSRKNEVSRKFLFIRYKTKKRVKNLSYTMNIGLVNSSYRNGFAYTSPSAPLNEGDFFAGYEFKAFRGFRLNSALDYTIFLHNKNAIQFSYLWDAYRTGGHHDSFEMAAHILKCSLLFGLR